MCAQLSISSCNFPLSHLHLADVSTERARNNVLSGAGVCKINGGLNYEAFGCNIPPCLQIKVGKHCQRDVRLQNKRRFSTRASCHNSFQLCSGEGGRHIDSWATVCVHCFFCKHRSPLVPFLHRIKNRSKLFIKVTA